MASIENPIIIVPARLASTRFPNKILADAQGKPLILRTAERVLEQVPELETYFAIDDKIVQDILTQNNFRTIMTDPLLPSGTDRIAFANEVLNRKFVINVQADEPLIKREHILKVINGLKKPEAAISTIATPFLREQDFQDSNQVKVVTDANGYALYFSRSPIPFAREFAYNWNVIDAIKPLKHLGIYGYKQEFLKDFLISKESELEKIEKLEQLRALQQGFRIAVETSYSDTVGVDVPSDLKEIKFS